jgi:hypothetical protein
MTMGRLDASLLVGWVEMTRSLKNVFARLCVRRDDKMRVHH